MTINLSEPATETVSLEALLPKRVRSPALNRSAKCDPIAELAAYGLHRDADFRYGFTPVYDLRTGKVSTLFCRAVCTRELRPLGRRDDFPAIGPRDMPRIDQAMLLQSLGFAQKLSAAGVTATIATSVSFETLVWNKGRQFYQNTLRATGSADNPHLIVRIDMIPSGTSTKRLAELVTAIRPYAKRIFLELPGNNFASLPGASLGANGYVCAAPSGMTQEETSALCLRFARLCALQGAFSCVEHIPDLAVAGCVRTAGIRFGEGPFLGQRLYFNDTPAEDVRVHQTETRDFSKMPNGA